MANLVLFDRLIKSLFYEYEEENIFQLMYHRCNIWIKGQLATPKIFINVKPYEELEEQKYK